MSIIFTPGETNIICTQLVRSLRFYQDVLGFAITEHEGPAAVHMSCGGRPFLLLAVAKSPLVDRVYCETPAVSFDLVVSDIGEAVSYFHHHGVAFESPWQKGESYVFIKDPDGLVIEVIQEQG